MSMSDKARPDRTAYKVGWLCALPEEWKAARDMMDDIYDPPLDSFSRDPNQYSYGRIGNFKVVLTQVADGGTNLAASAATNMIRSFELSYLLVVGMYDLFAHLLPLDTDLRSGGGVGGLENADVRLGDVVVSMPSKGSPPLIEYDFIKEFEGSDFKFNGMLHNNPPMAIQNTVRYIANEADSLHDTLETHLDAWSKRDMPAEERRRGQFPGRESDILFETGYEHIPQRADTCELCDKARVRFRAERANERPRVHLGLIASGDKVVKSSRKRDDIVEKVLRHHGQILCFEMEGAGAIRDQPYLVIRGVCDYADSHKNDAFHDYAALTAAAYAKTLLYHLRTETMPENKAQPSILKNQKPTIVDAKSVDSLLIFTAKDTRLNGTLMGPSECELSEISVGGPFPSSRHLKITSSADELSLCEFYTRKLLS